MYVVIVSLNEVRNKRANRRNVEQMAVDTACDAKADNAGNCNPQTNTFAD